jgi:hypothetical protein
MMMHNGDIVIPHHKFKQLSEWYYRVQKVENYEFPFVKCSIISTKCFINFRPAIIRLWNSNRRISLVKGWVYLRLGKVRSSQVSDVYAHRMTRNSVIVIPPHDFMQISRWYYGDSKIENYEFSFVKCGMISIQRSINFRTTIINLWNSYTRIFLMKGWV